MFADHSNLQPQRQDPHIALLQSIWSAPPSSINGTSQACEQRTLEISSHISEALRPPIALGHRQLVHPSQPFASCGPFPAAHTPTDAKQVLYATPAVHGVRTHAQSAGLAWHATRTPSRAFGNPELAPASHGIFAPELTAFDDLSMRNSHAQLSSTYTLYPSSGYTADHGIMSNAPSGPFGLGASFAGDRSSSAFFSPGHIQSPLPAAVDGLKMGPCMVTDDLFYGAPVGPTDVTLDQASFQVPQAEVTGVMYASASVLDRIPDARASWSTPAIPATNDEQRLSPISTHALQDAPIKRNAELEIPRARSIHASIHAVPLAADAPNPSSSIQTVSSKARSEVSIPYERSIHGSIHAVPSPIQRRSSLKTNLLPIRKRGLSVRFNVDEPNKSSAEEAVRRRAVSTNDACGPCKLRNVQCSGEKAKCARCVFLNLACTYDPWKSCSAIERKTTIMSAKSVHFDIAPSVTEIEQLMRKRQSSSTPTVGAPTRPIKYHTAASNVSAIKSSPVDKENAKAGQANCAGAIPQDQLGVSSPNAVGSQRVATAVSQAPVV